MSVKIGRAKRQEEIELQSTYKWGETIMQEVQKTKQPDILEALQEKLELEKEKRELISSLFDDWIYEYNIREHTFNTISGNGDAYQFVERRQGEKTFMVLAGLYPEDERRMIE